MHCPHGGAWTGADHLVRRPAHGWRVWGNEWTSLCHGLLATAEPQAKRMIGELRRCSSGRVDVANSQITVWSQSTTPRNNGPDLAIYTTTTSDEQVVATLLEGENVEIESSSASTAEVAPLEIRPGDRTRLVFMPQLVDNKRDAEASVGGTLAYQRKKANDAWESIESINLNSLKAGEGVKLALSTAEVARLHHYLSALYEIYDEDGVQNGKYQYTIFQGKVSALRVLDSAAEEADPGIMKAIFDWFARQDEEILKRYFGTSASDATARLENTLGMSRLERFLANARPLLDSDDESAWQRLLKEESWVIGQVYAQLVVFVGREVYVGGKNWRNQGGNFADFMYKSKAGNNALVVEIKTPKTPLLYTGKASESKEKYRNRIYNVHKELSGATQQVRQNVYQLSQDYPSLRALMDNPQDPEFNNFSPKKLLIIGSSTSLTDEEQRKSFELYRQNLRDVDIITFDELVGRVEMLLEVMRTSADLPTEGEVARLRNFDPWETV